MLAHIGIVPSIHFDMIEMTCPSLDDHEAVREVPNTFTVGGVSLDTTQDVSSWPISIFLAGGNASHQSIFNIWFLGWPFGDLCESNGALLYRVYIAMQFFLQLTHLLLHNTLTPFPTSTYMNPAL